MQLSDTHTLSPAVLNDLRLSLTQGNFSSTKAPKWEPFTGENLNTELGLPNITPGGLPSIGFGFGSSSSTEGVTHEYRYALTDIVYVSRKSMSWKFGVDLSRSLDNVKPLYGASGGIYSFSANQSNSTGGATNGTGGNTLASFLLGVPKRGGAAKYAHPLLLSLDQRGRLRTERLEGEAEPNPAHYTDFEPRFGFAWSPGLLKARQVTVRGGYGLSHAPVTGAARLPQPDFGTTSSAYNPTTGSVNPSYIMRLGSNPPKVTPQSPEQLLNIPSDGPAGHQLPGRGVRHFRQRTYTLRAELEFHAVLAGDPDHRD